MTRSIHLPLLLVLLAVAPACAGDKYALVVGVENYIPDQLPPLDYAEDDALALAAALEKLGFGVIAMTSQNKNPLQKPTTARNVLEQLSLRLADRRPDDTVVLAFSGHGVQFRGERENWFCPEQATASDRSSLVPMSHVLAEIGRCGAGRKLLLVDACREEIAPVAAGKGGAIELDPAAPARAAPPAGTVAVFSCRPSEKSYELGDLRHSVFTHHVIRYLSGDAPRDRYPEGQLGVLELAGFVSSHTREMVATRLGRSQMPELIAPEGTLSEWPLGRLADVPAAAGGGPSDTGRMAAAGPRVTENAIGMKLVRIETGEFLMGADDRADEQPPHRVRITRPFWLGQTEVTQGQFQGVMGTTPWRGQQHVRDGADHAATYVSWNDATDFCRRLSRIDRRTYRLPTEAEWEYACRARTTTRWSCDDAALDDHAWWGGFGDVGNAGAEQYAHQVGRKKPNPWGLHDMHGNVLEWCSDWLGAYDAAAAADPAGPPAPAAASLRVVRGGSWGVTADECRSAYRDGDAATARNGVIGFRVVQVDE